MVNKFIFQDDIQLSIMGEEFSLDSSDPTLLKTLNQFAKEGQEFGEKMKADTSKTEIEAIVEMARYCTTVIDSILGEGSSKRIFKDTPVSFFKAIAIINYVQEELKQGTDNVVSKYSSNRATRRKK